MRRAGFTLTEILIGLWLALFISIAAFEFFGITRDLFGKLKGEEMETQSAEAALEKIRTDFQRAGQGLVAPMRDRTVAGLELAGPALTIALSEKTYEISQDLLSGQTRVPLTATSGLSDLREICLVENGWGELHEISAVESGAVVLNDPIRADFTRTAGRLHLIERITYFLDEPAGVLRRRVNSSPAQPLLEDVDAVEFDYDAAANLARAGLSLLSSKERKYEISVFPKNIGLARPAI